MEPEIFTETHELKRIVLKEEPKDFRKPNSVRNIKTILRNDEPDIVRVTQFQSNPAISVIVRFMAYQLLNPKEKNPIIIDGNEVLIEIEFVSTYLFEVTREEPTDEFWCDLMQKTVEKLNDSYLEKTKNTYLEKSKLKIPTTMRNDCLRQKRINKSLTNN